MPHLTYAETVATIAAGGAYEGRMIADNAKAQAFTDAMLQGQTNNCAVSGSNTCADSLVVDFDSLVGSNYNEFPELNHA